MIGGGGERGATSAPADRMLAHALDALARGWLLTPLDGKRPILKGWPTLPAPTEADLRGWIEKGHNLGLRTGSASGVLVIDDDSPDGTGAAHLNLPPTRTARTGSGKRHYYFRAPAECPGNTSRLLGEHIDTRGEGGQVVFVGSRHPGTGKLYEWENDLPLADLPAHIFEQLKPRPRAPYSPPVRDKASDAWAHKALELELGAVAGAHAGDGRAHGQMCSSSFRLGQVAGAGLLELDAVIEQCVAAGCAAGWSESEARRVASDCAKAGTNYPRGPAPMPPAPEVRWPPPASSEAPDHLPEPAPAPKRKVLVPGGHTTPAGFVKQGPSRFADDAIAALPPGALYRRGTVAGSLVGKAGHREFRALSADRARSIVDRHAETVRWATPPATKTNPEPEPQEYFVPLTKDYGALVADCASDHEAVRALEWVSPYPFLGPAGIVTAAGYHAPGYFFDPPPGLAIPTISDPAVIRAALADLVIDFPFEDEASRQNFYGFLLTPILRPAIDGNVPIHAFTSSIARSGKSRLIEQVAGITVLGNEVPSSQLPPRPEDQPKFLFTAGLSGVTMMHLDNLPPELDSGPLASMVTSRTLSDRLLGGNQWVTVNNTLTVAISGNNLRLAGELAKRSVVVRLVPTTDHPEDRADFRHPDLVGYLRQARAHVLGCLVGAVRLWLEAGSPPCTLPFGGFEGWRRAVGGVLERVGLTEHLANRTRWRDRTDSEQEALDSLVAAWWERWGSQPVQAAQMLATIPDAAAGLLERPSVVTLGRKLAGLVDRRFGELVVEHARSGDEKARGYRLRKA